MASPTSQRLAKLKQQFDPENLFRHTKSVLG